MTDDLNQSTAELFAKFSDQLVTASDMVEDYNRVATFSKLANQHGDYSPRKSIFSYRRDEVTEPRPYAAICLYRDATEDQRLAIDDLMTRCPTRHAYVALMKSLASDLKDGTEGIVKITNLLYGAIALLAGEEGAPYIYETLRYLSTEALDVRGEGFDHLCAELAFLAICLAGKDGFHESLIPYFNSTHDEISALRPAINNGSGLLRTLKQEYLGVVVSHPELVHRLANAMKASPRTLSADELMLLVTGEQSISLVEGML